MLPQGGRNVNMDDVLMVYPSLRKFKALFGAGDLKKRLGRARSAPPNPHLFSPPLGEGAFPDSKIHNRCILQEIWNTPQRKRFLTLSVSANRDII
jgi:hypothetical protein